MPGKSHPASPDEGDLLEKAYLYLTERVYPEGCLPNQKQAIRRKAARFTIRNGDLMYQKLKRKTLDGHKVSEENLCDICYTPATCSCT